MAMMIAKTTDKPWRVLRKSTVKSQESLEWDYRRASKGSQRRPLIRHKPKRLRSSNSWGDHRLKIRVLSKPKRKDRRNPGSFALGRRNQSHRQILIRENQCPRVHQNHQRRAPPFSKRYSFVPIRRTPTRRTLTRRSTLIIRRLLQIRRETRWQEIKFWGSRR